MANEIARSLRKRMTPQEVKLWQQLRQLEDFHFRRQVPIGPYIVDFAEKTGKLVIEVDGSQHGEAPNLVKDAARDLYLKNKGFKVLRVWNIEVDQNLSGVIDTILLALK
jgi:very-short-patch-repair endonuclease